MEYLLKMTPFIRDRALLSARVQPGRRWLEFSDLIRVGSHKLAFSGYAALKEAVGRPSRSGLNGAKSLGKMDPM